MSDKKFSLRENAAIIAVLLVLVMTVLDGTIVNVALPVIAEELQVSDASSVWVVTIYQLVITMLLLPVSAIGERRGYKPVFLMGVALFTIASLICAEAGNFPFILLARGMQGIGAACIMGVNIALTRIIYPKEILGRGLALNAMVIAIATAAGPTLAGLMLKYWSWHWLFLINVPIGILTFILAFKLLPDGRDHTRKDAFDWRGAVGNAVFFGLVFYALGSFSHGASLWVGIPLLLIGLAIGYVYIRRQRRLKDPMFPLDLFSSALYSMSIATAICSFIAMNSAMVVLPFLLLNEFGFDTFATGLLMTPWPLATMIAAPLGARLSERWNPGITAAVGMSLFTVGLLLLIFISGTPSVIDVGWRMYFCGFGFGLFQTPNNLVMVSATPVRRTGAAGGMQSTGRLVGQTTGATIVALMFGVIPNALHAEKASLIAAASFALLAVILSVSRASFLRPLDEK